MIVMAFNRSALYELPFTFDLVWFKALATNERLLQASWNSVWIAAVNAVIATTLGTLAAYAFARYEFRGKRLLQLLLFPPITIPWLIIGTSMLIFFFWTGIGRGLHAILLGHVALSLPYVIVVVGARLAELRAGARGGGGDPRRDTVADLLAGDPAGAGARHRRRGAVRLRRLLRPVRHLLFPGAARHLDLAGRDLHRHPQGLHAGDQRHLDHHHCRLHGPHAGGGAQLSVRRENDEPRRRRMA